MAEKLFFDIHLPEIPEDFAGFTLETRWFEFLMALELQDLNLGRIGYREEDHGDYILFNCDWGGKLPKIVKEHFERMLPYHFEKTSSKKLEPLVDLAKEYPDPISKKVADLNELSIDVLKIYQLSYANYALGKHYPYCNWEQFPRSCCGPSSRGLFGSFLLNGFYNAAIACAEGDRDHTYNLFPFTIENPPNQGVIVLDSTSNQFGKYNGVIRRNLLFLKKGTTFDYKLDHTWNQNLFPDSILYLGSLNQEGLIREGGELDWDKKFYFEGGRKFLDAAYSNPVELDSKLIFNSRP